MDGIIIVDKQKGITSHDVVFKLRKILKTKKIGHTGTLDPIATGVLPICIGNCTKASNYLIADDKVYEAQIKLGILTDTSDITGNIIEERHDSNILEEQIKDVILSFKGKQTQIPPIYSAIKVNGKKLYEYARQGIQVEIPSRQIEIFDIKVSNINIKENIVDIIVHCSKGTYIRSLCVDIGKKLGTVATMAGLRRIKSGIFKIEDSIKLEDINEDIKLITLEQAFINLPKISLNNNEVEKLLNGVKINTQLEEGIYRLYITTSFIGLGSIENSILKRKIITM